MSTMSTEEMRTAANSVLDRARTEPAFLATLTANPVAVLQAAGLPLEDAREFSQELDTNEVGGYSYRVCRWTCDTWSCAITLCSRIPMTN